MPDSASSIPQAQCAPAAFRGDVLLAKPQAIRILLAGDATGSAAQALRGIFSPPEHALELTAVSSVTTLLPTIGVVEPEIILLDLNVAYPQPKETVRRIRRAAPNIPLIVLADAVQKEEAKHTLTAGAMDYVLQEFMADATLARVLRSALERNTLEGLADFLRDPVTSLYTRDGLLTLGSNAIDSMRRKRGSLALFCILVQNLGALREQEGKAAADHALQQIALDLTHCFRRSDIVARIGDAQFAALAVDTAEPGVAVVTQRLARLIAELPFQRDSSRTLRFLVRHGMWTCSEEHIAFAAFLDNVESRLRVDLPAHPE
jgi:diguanylate cyclase (GGDEF)-like protein